MKSFLLWLSFVFFCCTAYAQVYTIEANHPVYNFLNRMTTAGFIVGYDNFEIPKSQKTIAGYLRQIIAGNHSIASADGELARKFYAEFAGDSIAEGSGFPALYCSVIDSIITINLRGRVNAGFISLADSAVSLPIEPSLSLTAGLGTNAGFRIKVANGKVIKNKNAALTLAEYYSNFKLNESPEESFFDNTEGSLRFENSYFSAGIGRERLYRGFGTDALLIGSFSPVTDYLSMHVTAGSFAYDYLHCRLLGGDSTVISQVYGPVKTITEKYLAYHRVSFNTAEQLRIGVGEAVIYSRRGLDLSYLNPIAFYKSVEHSNRDRDNALLFVDAQWKPAKSLSLTGIFLIDDLDFSKLGTGWIANKFAWQTNASWYISTGGYSSILNVCVTGIDPYTYTHRLPENTYSHFSMPLATEQPPNSLNYGAHAEISIPGGLEVSLSANYILHGDNEYSSAGALLRNHGGRLNSGITEFDEKYNKFLAGNRKTYSNLTGNVKYYSGYRMDVNLRLRYGYLNFKDFENKVLQVYCIVGFNF